MPAIQPADANNAEPGEAANIKQNTTNAGFLGDGASSRHD